MHIYDRLGVQPVINARGYSTKVGGCALPVEVVESMRQAAEHCVRIDELQQAASRAIAEATGAEAGIVTSGASAALTLAAAACLAGLDVGRMNRLPDTVGFANEIIVHRSHRNDYDHALLAAGARFVEVGFGYCTHSYEIEQEISANTAALYYQAGGDGLVMTLQEFAAIAHRHAMPVIVDAATELPPPENLRASIAAGADLVAFSGGKHIRGPQCTGILCGRADLILSATLQHQDMDVFANSWPLRSLACEGPLAGPPHHGIGRGFKVGKEEIAGLLTALESYARRDFQAERNLWLADMQCVASSVVNTPGIRAEIQYPQPNGRMVPAAVMTLEPLTAGFTANDLVNTLQNGSPPIFVFERWADTGRVVFLPEALRQGDAAIISRRLREILHSEKAS